MISALPASNIQNGKSRRAEPVKVNAPVSPPVALQGQSYKSVPLEEASRMLGYFTQGLKYVGLPWHLERETPGLLGRRVQLSQLEAIEALGKGETVILQPMRFVDLNPDALKPLALLGTPLAPFAGTAATVEMKKFEGKATPDGMEIKNGKGIPLHNLGELKLLYELYNPQAEIKEKNQFGETATKLASFVQKSWASQYPWHFHSTTRTSFCAGVKKVLASGMKSALIGGIVGGIVGAVLGGPVGGALGLKIGLFSGVETGAILAGLYSTLKEVPTARRGEQLTPFETIQDLMTGKPVLFQEKKLRRIDLLFFGGISYYNDYGKGSIVKSLDDLKTLHAINIPPPQAQPAPGQPPPTQGQPPTPQQTPPVGATA